MNHEFWWNWFVQLGVAVGTIGAVGVGLWSAFRQVKRAVLVMKVLREEGEFTKLNTGEPVQMFHLEVSNAQRDVVATRVQVYLSALAIVRGEKLEEVWRGDLALRWRDQEFVPKFQKIGGAKHCDLFRCGKLSGITLMTLFVPNTLATHTNYIEKCTLALFLQARSNQADSELTRFDVHWNGLWAEDGEEMKQHLQIFKRLRLR